MLEAMPDEEKEKKINYFIDMAITYNKAPKECLVFSGQCTF